MTRRHFILWAGAVVGARFRPTFEVASTDISAQPYFAGVNRALDTLAKLGSPIAVADAQRIAALTHQNDSAAVNEAEKILNRYTLASLSFNFDGSAQVGSGGAAKILIEQGWRMFLVRIANSTGRTESINFSTGTPGWNWYFGGPGRILPFFDSLSQRAFLMDTLNKGPLIEKLWLMTQLYDTAPIIYRGVEIPTISLSGLPVEYRVIQLFSQDSGSCSANLVLSRYPREGHGSVDFVRRAFDFTCLPSRTVRLGVLDADGRGCIASLTIKDSLNHIYPPQTMRLAPDLSFQAQVYRADGETMRLADAQYTVESKRGPEYLRSVQTVTIDASHNSIDVRLQRWIDPAKWGWYSGDTHIHAGGCAHYEIPTAGVAPETMIRQVRGEALSVGDVLSWAPSWYYQKQFFTGHTQSPVATLEHPELQVANNASLQPHPTVEDSESTLRYDVEVSGFPSSHAGHLVLLRLKDQDYPGTKLIEDWPTWNLPILVWARVQGAVAGYAHCGYGMVVDSNELPNYEIPPMDSVGTQEAIVDVTHGLVDFLSGCDTVPVAELNAWYHMLNCGFRLGMLGETDFPCISGERPGTGRSYVRLDNRPVGEAGYEAWIRGLQQGRLYCGDGRSHFLDFNVDGHRSGDGDLILVAPSTLNIEALVAARLEPEPVTEFQATERAQRKVWDLELARVGTTREVPVEIVVNGIAVDRTMLVADGTPQSIKFKPAITRSSWVALRILPSAHTHPVFVQVAEKPIRASRRSAQWCRACVDKVWEVKSPFIRESELATAAKAFDHARKIYNEIIDECEVA